MTELEKDESTQKVAKKATKKISKKATKKISKKVSKKVAKKTTKKPVAKKATKKVARKVTKKVGKKASKKTAKKATNKPVNQTEGRLDSLQDLLQENLSGLSADKAELVAKKIWLAGLGAYSRSFEVEELVEKGESMQGDIDKALKKGRDSLEERVDEFKERFGGGLSSFVDIPERLREAAGKIEAISKKLQKK